LGIKTFFSKEGRQSRHLDRNARVVANVKAAGEDRWAAMLELAKEASGEAIHALLVRYTYTAEVGTRSRVTDEQEKNLVFDLVTEIGEAALSEVSKFLLSEEGPVGQPKHSISFALRILETISPDPETTWSVLHQVILANEPGYERDPSRKIELLTFLGQWRRDPRVTEAILGYLDDADEGVRFQCAEALLGQGSELCKERLLAIVREQDESYQMRNRILSGFIDNGWVEEVLPFLEKPDEPGLVQVAESLVMLPDDGITKEPLLRIIESNNSSERLLSRVSEWFVNRQVSTHGIRGRLEKILPRGYKVAKKQVERFPESMREPYLSLAVEGLMALDDPGIGLEPLIRILRNRELAQTMYLRALEFLVRKAWPLGELDKMARKVLPEGYVVGGSGVIEREISAMREPFLTAAGDNLLDLGDPEDPAMRRQLLEILVNNGSDERVRERIFDRFSREEWSVLGFEKEIERRMSKEFKVQGVGHGLDYRVVRVLARI
jgi:hypothetical protein